jgi:hypothetical protein
VVVRVGAVLCAELWGVSAASKLTAPFAAYEIVALVVGSGLVAKLAFGVVVAAETLLATLALLGLAPRRTLWWSLAALAALTLVLFVARRHLGGDVPCGCGLGVLDTDIDGAVARNGALIGLLAVLLGLDLALASPPRPRES